MNSIKNSSKTENQGRLVDAVKLFCFISAFFLTVNIKSQCSASFVYTLGAGGTATFQSTSSGTTSSTSYNWMIGNSFFSNWGSSVTYTFSDNAIFTASLQIVDVTTTPNCNSSSTTQTINISTAPCFTNAGFSSSPGPNGTVSFYQYPQGGSGYTYAWNFGDGSTGSAANPAHTYTANGTYTVSLIAVSYSASCTYSLAHTLSVTIVTCPPTSFNYSVGSSNTVTFACTSSGTPTNVSTYGWDFNDGVNLNGANTTSHTFTNSGTYLVKLVQKITYGNGVMCRDSIFQSVTVPASTCNAVTNFNLIKDTAQAFTWIAAPSYPSNASAVEWSWGDGSTSTGMYPSHTYSAANFYTICVTVTLTCGSTTKACKYNYLYKGAPADMLYVNVVKGVATGIEKNSGEDLEAFLFPNPTSGILNVKFAKSINLQGIAVYDLVGKKVYENHLSQTQSALQIDLSSFENGIYFIQLQSDQKSVISKFVITK